jgi:hypothetical protein
LPAHAGGVAGPVFPDAVRSQRTTGRLMASNRQANAKISKVPFGMLAHCAHDARSISAYLGFPESQFSCQERTL